MGWLELCGKLLERALVSVESDPTGCHVTMTFKSAEDAYDFHQIALGAFVKQEPQFVDPAWVREYETELQKPGGPYSKNPISH